ncbi:MAG: 50S ribosomal protein L32 [Deferrisomatales bacterium]
MAVPKRRTSLARKRKRRSHLSLVAPNLDKCPKCLEPKQPHHACAACGTYKGRQVLPLKEEEAEA